MNCGSKIFPLVKLLYTHTLCNAAIHTYNIMFVCDAVCGMRVSQCDIKKRTEAHLDDQYTICPILPQFAKNGQQVASLCEL